VMWQNDTPASANTHISSREFLATHLSCATVMPPSSARIAAAITLLVVPSFSLAQGVPDNTARELRRQEERVNAIRQQQERSVDVRRPAAPAADPSRLPDGEKPCFTVDRLVLAGDEQGEFGWLPAAAAGTAGDDPPQGRCLGRQGVGLVLKRLQNALVARGYITSRVTLPQQDLRRGELTIALTPGRIQGIRHAADSQQEVCLRAAVPAAPGELLNLRDVEQGLENLRNVPTADADIQIVPGDQPGQSDLVIAYRQAFPLRATLTADDGGTKATGKYQGSATVAWDNPAGLSDLLYATLNHDLVGKGDRGTYGGLVHYSVPFGYWNGGITYDRGKYHQTIAGAFQNYVYSGRNSNIEMKLSRLVRRDATSKTAVAAGAFRRTANNYIDDTEVEVQQRHTGGWLATLNHRHFFGTAMLDATLGYKRGTGAFGAQAAPEEPFGEGTSRFRIITVDLSYALPFTAADMPFRYQINLRGQKDETRLAAPERFVIGGRNSVRGFDGETILSAENGWLIRNDVSTPIGQGVEAYAGLDYGEVGGPTADLLIGKRLAGFVLGVRGGWKNVRYEVFAGTPVHKPDGFVTAGATGGFSFSATF